MDNKRMTNDHAVWKVLHMSSAPDVPQEIPRRSRTIPQTHPDAPGRFSGHPQTLPEAPQTPLGSQNDTKMEPRTSKHLSENRLKNQCDLGTVFQWILIGC